MLSQRLHQGAGRQALAMDPFPHGDQWLMDGPQNSLAGLSQSRSKSQWKRARPGFPCSGGLQGNPDSSPHSLTGDLAPSLQGKSVKEFENTF